MKKPLHSALHGQETPLDGFDVPSSTGQDNTPETPLQPQKRLAVVLGVCCKCGERPATLKSPSGQSIYCEQCGRSRCGVHTVLDFVQEECTGLWLDPCCVKHDLKQQSLVEEK